MSAALPEASPARAQPAHAHVPALDAVRGLAILMVTAYRFSRGSDGAVTGAGRFVLRVLVFGEQGVDLFFVLSGFLITGILISSKATPGYFRNFYMRRLLRIFPLYYGVLVVVLVLLPLVARPALVEEVWPHRTWLWLYGANVLLSIKHAWLLGGFNHFWSLAVEEHFYLVWPLVIFCCSTRTAARICVATMALALALRAWLVWHGDTVSAEALTPCRMDALAAGALVALLAHERGIARLGRRAVVAAAVSAALLVAVHGWDASVYSVRYTLYAVLFAALIVLAVSAAPSSLPGRVAHLRALRFFGRYSYGLYVFQGLLAFVAAPHLPAFMRACGSPLAGTLAFMVFWSAVALALALASWHLYEQRFLALKRHFQPRG